MVKVARDKARGVSWELISKYWSIALNYEGLESHKVSHESRNEEECKSMRTMS